MQSLTLHTRVGKDGILKLETPVNVRNAEVEVVLVVNRAAEKPRKQPAKKAKAWPPGFLDTFAGSMSDLPPRAPQGEYELRDGLE